MSNKTLKDVMPVDLSERGGSYHNTRAFTMLDVKVVAEHGDLGDDHPRGWPGTHKNVYFWVELENGYACGWNENPARGWSFPLFKLKSEKFLKSENSSCNL